MLPEQYFFFIFIFDNLNHKLSTVQKRWKIPSNYNNWHLEQKIDSINIFIRGPWAQKIIFKLWSPSIFTIFHYFFVRLQRSLPHNALAPFFPEFCFWRTKTQKTESNFFEMLCLGGSVNRYLLHKLRRYCFGLYCIWKQKTCLTMN